MSKLAGLVIPEECKAEMFERAYAEHREVIWNCRQYNETDDEDYRADALAHSYVEDGMIECFIRLGIYPEYKAYIRKRREEEYRETGAKGVRGACRQVGA